MPGRILDLYENPIPEQPCWVANGVLTKGSILLLGGPAKIGKSFLVLDLAHNLTQRGLLWGLKQFYIPQAVPVIYVEAEIGEVELQRRVKMYYEAVGVPPSPQFHYSSREKEFFLDTSIGEAKLKQRIKATGAKVLIVDPVSRVILGDENDSTDIGKLFRRLDNLIVDVPDLSIVLAHHTRKEPLNREGYDPLSPNEFRGSSKFFGNPDSLIVFQKVPKQEPGEWWRLRTHFELRGGEPPEDIMLAVTEGGVVKEARKRSLQVAPEVGWRR